MSTDLPGIQQRFRDVVLSDDDAPIASLVQAPAGAVARRIAIYRNTVQASLVEVLATAFPVVERIVGDAFFAGLARRFIVAAPPRIPQLSLYGAAFADFVAASEVGQRLPYLTDVAKLEWARGEAYFAAHARLLDPAALTRIPPDDLADLALSLHPAVRLIGSPYPIYRIWEVNQPQVTDVPRVDMGIGQCVLITRPQHHVLTRLIDAGDAAFISAVQAGLALAPAAERGVDTDHAFDLQAALARHFLGGTFAAAR